MASAEWEQDLLARLASASGYWGEACREGACLLVEQPEQKAERFFPPDGKWPASLLLARPALLPRSVDRQNREYGLFFPATLASTLSRTGRLDLNELAGSCPGIFLADHGRGNILARIYGTSPSPESAYGNAARAALPRLDLKAPPLSWPGNFPPLTQGDILMDAQRQMVAAENRDGLQVVLLRLASSEAFLASEYRIADGFHRPYKGGPAWRQVLATAARNLYGWRSENGERQDAFLPARFFPHFAEVLSRHAFGRKILEDLARGEVPSMDDERAMFEDVSARSLGCSLTEALQRLDAARAMCPDSAGDGFAPFL